jgi:hypothetical protein
MSTALILLSLLTFKHFIVDFPLQGEYQWRNKGTFLHPGGLLHAGLHGLATFLILGFFTTPLIGVIISLAETVVHYLIDYVKMNINSRMGWECNKNPEFWVLLGLDQFLHSMTYIAIIYLIF